MKRVLVELRWNDKARTCTCAASGATFTAQPGLIVSLRGRDAPISPAFIASVDAHAAAKFERMAKEAAQVVDLMARNKRPYSPVIPDEHFDLPE